MNKLLFVCGFPSGGTELTKTILNSHPDIHIADEMPWLKGLYNHGYIHSTKFSNYSDILKFTELLNKWDKWNVMENLDYDFSKLIEEKKEVALEEVLKLCWGAEHSIVWGNKTPQYTEIMDELYGMFPNAFFLIVTRDIRDICLSWKNKWGKNMLFCTLKWADRMAYASNWADRMAKETVSTQKGPKNRCLILKYEDLLSNTSEITRNICKFLNISYSTNMIEPHKHTKERISGKMNYGEPIKKDNFGKWKSKLPQETIQRIEEISYDTMKLFGYEPEYAVAHKPITMTEKFSGIVHDITAMFLIGNRYSQNNTTWDKIKEVFYLVYWKLVNK